MGSDGGVYGSLPCDGTGLNKAQFTKASGVGTMHKTLAIFVSCGPFPACSVNPNHFKPSHLQHSRRHHHQAIASLYKSSSTTFASLPPPLHSLAWGGGHSFHTLVLILSQCSRKTIIPSKTSEITTQPPKSAHSSSNLSALGFHTPAVCLAYTQHNNSEVEQSGSSQASLPLLPFLTLSSSKLLRVMGCGSRVMVGDLGRNS
ncbi:hypothetical protein E2C01_032784 [Portunus trituberculatus]|uniref:Uncharacterized protein n=1 Tax=Portunus trituberculatus TaxID=210409 RepID=A0A5B7F3T9_PORTR|nr:hypothetical protein [Portunus trituberculatus]